MKIAKTETNILALPDEALINIFNTLLLKDKQAARVACRGFYQFFQRQPFLLDKKILWNLKPRTETTFEIRYPHNFNILHLTFIPGSDILVGCTASSVLFLDCKNNLLTQFESELPSEGWSFCSVSKNWIAIEGNDFSYRVYSIHDQKLVLSIKKPLSFQLAILSENRFFTYSEKQILYYDLKEKNPERKELIVSELKIAHLMTLSDSELIIKLKQDEGTKGSSYYYYNINHPEHNKMIVNEALYFQILHSQKSYYITKENELYAWEKDKDPTLISDLSQFSDSHFTLLSNNYLLMTKTCNKVGGGMMSMYWYNESTVSIYSFSAEKVLGTYTYSHTSYPSFVASPHGHFAHLYGNGESGKGKYYLIKVRSYFDEDSLKQDSVVVHDVNKPTL